MPILIGIDEAGYAPNLGPLVIGASVWEVPSAHVDLYQVLEKVVSSRRTHGKAHLADSKQVHAPHDPTVLARQLAIIHPDWEPGGPISLNALIKQAPQLDLGDLQSADRQTDLFAAEDSVGTLQAEIGLEPTLGGPDIRLPVACDEQTSGIVFALRDQFESICRAEHVRLLKLVAIPIFPRAYNLLCHRLGNKSTMLSAISLTLVRHFLDAISPQATTVFCDKHGGRNHYRLLLQRYLPPIPWELECEGTQLSRYNGTLRSHPLRIQFSASGEAALPVAVASMQAKLMREMCMLAFNRYWKQLLPDLTPTKGYPLDAQRFRRDIHPVIAAGRWDELNFWRQR